MVVIHKTDYSTKQLKDVAENKKSAGANIKYDQNLFNGSLQNLNLVGPSNSCYKLMLKRICNQDRGIEYS